MSDQDIQQAIGSVEMAGLSPAERKSIVVSFANFALSQMDDVTLKLLKEDKSAIKMLSSLGVSLPEGATNQITLTSPSGKTHQWDEGNPEIEEARKHGWK